MCKYIKCKCVCVYLVKSCFFNTNWNEKRRHHTGTQYWSSRHNKWPQFEVSERSNKNKTNTAEAALDWGKLLVCLQFTVLKWDTQVCVSDVQRLCSSQGTIIFLQRPPPFSLFLFGRSEDENCFQSNELCCFSLPAYSIHTYESIHYNPSCTIAFLTHPAEPGWSATIVSPQLSLGQSSSHQTQQEVRLAQQWLIYRSINLSISITNHL